MTTTAEEYSGIDILEIMEEARNYNRFLLDLIHRHADGADRIMDFGAGSGTLAGPVADTGRKVVCVEPDARLRDRLAARKLEAHADVRAAGTADFIYSFNVLEHIEDDAGALSDLHKALAPNGRLLLYVPAFQVLYTAFDTRVGHHRRYHRRELVDRVKAAGFAVERASYVDSLGFFATLAYKMMDRGTGTLNRRMLVAYDRLVFPVSRGIDRVAGKIAGKNLLVVARKPG